MPTYEYACTSCGHHVEVFQSFAEEPLATCPNCGGDLRKVFGSIGIVLKGSGFYRTDSRASSNGKAASREKESREKDTKKDAVSPASGSEPAAPASTGTTAASTSSSASNSSPNAVASAS